MGLLQMSELLNLRIAEALKLLKKGEVSAKELKDVFINRVKETQGLNAYTHITEDMANKQAAEADARYKAGNPLPLDGIPVAIKDLYCVKGVEATACSKILEGFVPDYDSTVSDKLLKSGTVLIGKTNMDEFAMGSSNTNSAMGNVKSPWKRSGDDKDLVPGGSSGGSASAVAARTCMASLGSDTGGSIRQPASFCGIVGVKPTYGRCSRFGMIAFASSLDQAGCFTQSVEDAALVLQAISGYDPKDSTSYNTDVPDYSAQLNQDLKGVRIGIPKEYRVDGMPQEIVDMWDKGIAWLKQQGAEVVDISLPHTEYALPTYYIIAPAEASSNLARYDGVRFGKRVAPENGNITDLYELSRANGFGNEVKRRIMIGTYVLSAGYYDAYYTKAQKVRNRIYQDFKDAYTKVDAILTPTAPSEAFAIGENEDDPIKMYLNDVFTVPASLAGLPCMSVPAVLTKNGLPLGLQVITNHFQEVTMFKVAAALERAAGFKGL